MSVLFGRIGITAAPIRRRCFIALAVAFCDVAAVQLCFRFDVLGVFGAEYDLSCPSLGLSQRVCWLFDKHAVPQSLILIPFIIGALIALGVYDPRPLLNRLEQSRRPGWWLLVSAAGAAVFIFPYLLAAAGAPISSFAPWSPYLLILGASMMIIGLLCWLSDIEQLQGTLKPRHVLALIVLIPATVAIKEGATELGWGVPVLQAATFNTTALFLQLLGEPVIYDPEQSLIGIDNFSIQVAAGCSGIAGILLVSTVMAGYILAFKEQLKISRALVLIPLAAGLSWVLNGVRIGALLWIGAHVSPELAVDGFHTYAGWLVFCALSAAMLLVAENLSWIRPREIPAAASNMPLRSDPVVAQIAPFVVLLASSLISGAIFVQPESGYPLRAILMAAAVLLFWKTYRAEIGAVGAVPLLGGTFVALIWLAVKSGGSPLTTADILGPASQAAVIAWVLFRLFGTVFLVPFIEEMFFRGYLLQRLDFGGLAGKLTALAISSALFGALHSNFWLAAASGLLFGVLALRRGRVFDAVAAHATSNAFIAAWAVSTGDWSVI